MTNDVQELVARIQQLEQFRRRAVQSVTGLLICTATVLLFTAQSRPINPPIRATSFELVDSSNRVRGKLVTSDGVPRFDLLDANGKLRFSVSTSEDGAFMSLLTTGKTQLNFGVSSKTDANMNAVGSDGMVDFLLTPGIFGMGDGRVARPFGFAPTDPSVRLSRTRLFPRVVRVIQQEPPASERYVPAEVER